MRSVAWMKLFSRNGKRNWRCKHHRINCALAIPEILCRARVLGKGALRPGRGHRHAYSNRVSDQAKLFAGSPPHTAKGAHH